MYEQDWQDRQFVQMQYTHTGDILYHVYVEDPIYVGLKAPPSRSHLLIVNKLSHLISVNEFVAL